MTDTQNTNENNTTTNTVEVNKFNIPNMGRNITRTTESYTNYSASQVEKTQIVENLRKKIEKSPAMIHLIEMAFTDGNGNVDKEQADKILENMDKDDNIGNKVEFVKICTLLNELDTNGILIQDKYKKEFAQNLFSNDKKETLSYENFSKYIKENGMQKLSFPYNFIIEDDVKLTKQMEYLDRRFPDNIELNEKQKKKVENFLNNTLEDNNKRVKSIKDAESLNKFYEDESNEIHKLYEKLYKDGYINKSIPTNKIFKINEEDDKKEYEAIKNNPAIVSNLTAIQNSDMYRDLYKAKYGRYPDPKTDSIYDMDVDITKFYRLTTDMLQYIILTCKDEKERQELLSKLEQFMEKERINIGKNGGKIDMDEILARFDKEFGVEEKINKLFKQRDDSIDETGTIDGAKFSVDDMKQLNLLKNIKDLKNVKAIANGTGEDMVCHMANEFYRNNQQEKYKQKLLNDNYEVVGKEINKPLSSLVSALTSKKFWGIAIPEAITVAFGVIFPPAMLLSVGTYLSMAHRKSEPVLFYNDIKEKVPLNELPQLAKFVRDNNDELEIGKKQKHNPDLSIEEKNRDKLEIKEKRRYDPNISIEDPNISIEEKNTGKFKRKESNIFKNIFKQGAPNTPKKDPNVFINTLKGTKEPNISIEGKGSNIKDFQNNIVNKPNDINNDKISSGSLDETNISFGGLNMKNLKDNIANQKPTKEDNVNTSLETNIPDSDDDILTTKKINNKQHTIGS